MRALLLPLLVATAVGAAPEKELGTIVRNVNRHALQKLGALAGKAEKAKLFKTARQIYERIVLLDPDHSLARRKLGFRRRRGAWEADEKTRDEIYARKDEDYFLPAEYRKQARTLESERISELVRVCVAYGSEEERKRYLEPLLRHHPRRVDLHEALGHRKLGNQWIRPELYAMARRMRDLVREWRTFGKLPVSPEKSDHELKLPGVELDLVFYETAGRRVAASAGRGLSRAAARDAERSHRFLRDLLGAGAPHWDPPVVVFLEDEYYARVIRTLHPEQADFQRYYRYAAYYHPDFHAIRAFGRADAADSYGHAAGFLTINRLTRPGAKEAGDALNWERYAWLAEGLGYLVSFELFDSGYLYFVSTKETSRKIRFTRDPPTHRTRKACLDWLSEQWLAGHGHSLREVCSKSLNSLDFFASMEAYAFVRFLFLLDPEGARELPSALAAQKKGPQIERVERALRKIMGKGLAELTPLWRAFVLEIDWS